MKLRNELDLFANVVHVRSLPGVKTRHTVSQRTLQLVHLLTLTNHCVSFVCAFRTLIVLLFVNKPRANIQRSNTNRLTVLLNAWKLLPPRNHCVSLNSHSIMPPKMAGRRWPVCTKPTSWNWVMASSWEAVKRYWPYILRSHWWFSIWHINIFHSDLEAVSTYSIRKNDCWQYNHAACIKPSPGGLGLAKMSHSLTFYTQILIPILILNSSMWW